MRPDVKLRDVELQNPNNLATERVEILVEELSMSEFLKGFLPRILSEKYILEQNYFIRPHNGKNDLQKSIPKKIRGFRNFHQPTKFVIVHDQDSNDCRTLKKELQGLCGAASVLIRIPCRELESWYLGDMDSLEALYPRFKSAQYRHRKAFRNPDECSAAAELERLIPEFQKVAAARSMASRIAITTNTSPSFQAFVRGLEQFLA